MLPALVEQLLAARKYFLAVGRLTPASRAAREILRPRRRNRSRRASTLAGKGVPRVAIVSLILVSLDNESFPSRRPSNYA
jgi:hypothetical protein